MDNVKAMEEAKKVDLEVEHGAARVRRQINFGLIREVQDDEYFNDMAMDIRKTFNDGTRQTRRKIETMIAELESPEPPTPVPGERNPYFHLDALGIFLDVLAHAWKPKYEESTFARIEEVIAKATQEYGVSAVGYFSFLFSGKRNHKHLNWKAPWEVKKKLLKKYFDFETPSERYWYLRDRFMLLLDKYHADDVPQAWMWGKYSFPVFDRNVNGINGWTDPEAREVMLQHGLNLAKNGVAYSKQWLKALNEGKHTSDAMGHWIAEFHKDMYHTVKDYVKLKHFVCDATASEFSFCQLIEHLGSHRYCPKCGRPWDNPEGSNRIVKQEKHGVSIKGDLYGYVPYVSLDGFLRSGWHDWKVSEDGSSNPDAKLVPIEGMRWRYGDYAQVKEMLVDCWTRCKNHNRKKETIFGLFPMETFIVRSWGIEEWYSVDSIDWTRFAAVRDAYEEVYG